MRYTLAHAPARQSRLDGAHHQAGATRAKLGFGAQIPAGNDAAGSAGRQHSDGFRLACSAHPARRRQLYFTSPPQIPAGWEIVRAVELHQMVQETEAPPTAQASATPEVIELTPADVPEMSVVYTATRPGRTLCPRIQKLGQFLGIREERRQAGGDGRPAAASPRISRDHHRRHSCPSMKAAAMRLPSCARLSSAFAHAATGHFLPSAVTTRAPSKSITAWDSRNARCFIRGPSAARSSGAPLKF